MIARYSVENDGRHFRREAFSAFADHYRRHIAEAVGILNGLTFEFPEMTKAHVEQLRPDLLFRHALPFCITEEAYFTFDERSAAVLAALLAGHTLALTQLDYHLDGSGPDEKSTATGQKIDPATAVAYAVRMIYAAGRICDQSGLAGFFQQVFDPVSGFVISRMHQDWRERYQVTSLSVTQTALNGYLTSSTTRLQASGYWEVMVRGPFARHGITPPEQLVAVVRILRTLRQAVDEIADFDDDLAAGLVTSPLMFALSQEDGRSLAREVEAYWGIVHTGSDDDRTRRLRQCRERVQSAGGFQSVFEFAHRQWERADSICAGSLGRRAPNFLTLLDLKRAKLQELTKNDWRNITTDMHFY